MTKPIFDGQPFLSQVYQISISPKYLSSRQRHSCTNKCIPIEIEIAIFIISLRKIIKYNVNTGNSMGHRMLLFEGLVNCFWNIQNWICIAWNVPWTIWSNHIALHSTLTTIISQQNLPFLFGKIINVSKTTKFGFISIIWFKRIFLHIFTDLISINSIGTKNHLVHNHKRVLKKKKKEMKRNEKRNKIMCQPMTKTISENSIPKNCSI